MACGNQNEKAEGNCKLRVWSQYYEIFEICSTPPKYNPLEWNFGFVKPQNKSHM